MKIVSIGYVGYAIRRLTLLGYRYRSIASGQWWPLSNGWRCCTYDSLEAAEYTLALLTQDGKSK